MTDERAQVLLALARVGETPAVLSALQGTEPPGRLRSPTMLASLSRAARIAGRAEDTAALQRRLLSLAQDDGTFCHWGNDVEATALALKAVLPARRDASLAPSGMEQKVARWLLAHRDEDHWLSTRATARVLGVLVDYLVASGETTPDYEVVPSLNGHALPPVRFDRSSIFRPETLVTLDPRWLVPAGRGENVLRLEKRGAGSLYYTVRVKQFVGQEDLRVIVGGAGIALQRSYHELRPAKVVVRAQYGEEEGMRTRLLPADKPVERLRAGEAYLGRIEVQCPRDFEHVVIEEPIPAGCEPVDRGRTDAEEWGHWWSDMDVRDHQIAFFARRLPKGKHVLEYYLRASIPGRYHVMPTALSGMYDPAIRASGAETRVEVR